MRKFWILIGFCLTLSVGCGGGSNRPPLTAVTGTVTYNGKALAAGTIVFYPEKGRSGTGEIVDGKITKVSTFAPNDGAPIGKLRVAVISLEPANPSDAMAPRASLIPEKYNRPETANESVTTVAGKVNEVKIELKD